MEFSVQHTCEDLFGVIKGVTKTEVYSAIIKLKTQLEGAKESNQSISSIYLQQISTQLINLEAYLNQHIPSNPSGHIPGLLGVLYALSSAVDLAIPGLNENPSSTKRFTKKL